MKKNILPVFFIFLLIVLFLLSFDRIIQSNQKKEIKNVPEIITPIIPSKDSIKIPILRYPEKELWLGFISGMTKNEFHNHAKKLIDKGKLSDKNKGVNFHGEWKTDKIIQDYTYLVNGYHIRIDAGFENTYGKFYLTHIKLKRISSIHDDYSKKYNIPKVSNSNYYVQGYKIGKYNKHYNKKYSMEIRVESELGNGFMTKKSVKMPKEFIDKAKTLDFFEEKIYYDNRKDYSKKLKTFDKLIEIDSSVVLFYRKYWRNERWSSVEKYSLDDFQINPQISAVKSLVFIAQDLGSYDLTKTQSKQIIVQEDWTRNIDVTYTTKKYYIERLKPKPVKESELQSVTNDSTRIISDEI